MGFGHSDILKVAVSPSVPVDCLFAGDLAHTCWKEVELRSHLEMLGVSEWACLMTRSMAARRGDQTDLEPGTMAQTSANKRKGRGCGKPARTSHDPRGG